MDHFKKLKILLQKQKSVVKKELLQTQNLLLFVSLIFNILKGNLPIKHKKSLVKYKNLLLKIGSLDSCTREKRSLIKKISAITLKNILIKTLTLAE